MIAHGRDIVINMDIHDAIARSCYCHREVLSMHLSEELDDKRANGAPTSKRSSFNLSWCITRIWSITSRGLGWICRNAVFDKEAVREELRNQKLK